MTTTDKKPKKKILPKPDKRRTFKQASEATN
jgi:hypothetical protein